MPIPDALEQAIMACLEKDPDHRPQTADDLAARLSCVRTTGSWTPARTREWWDTNHPPNRVIG